MVDYVKAPKDRRMDQRPSLIKLLYIFLLLFSRVQTNYVGAIKSLEFFNNLYKKLCVGLLQMSDKIKFSDSSINTYLLQSV